MIELHTDNDLFTPNPGGQTEFLNDWEHYYCAIQGGLRSGKTYALAVKALIALTLNNQNQEGYDGLLMSLDYNSLNKALVPQIQDFAQKMGLECKWRKLARTLVFPQLNAKMHCYTSENSDSIISIEVAFVALDEVARYRVGAMPAQDPILNAVARCSAKGALIKQCMFATSPEGANTRFHRMFHLDKNPQAKLYIASARDNPHIDVSQHEKIYSGAVAKSYIDGQSMDLGGSIVYDCFEENRNVSDQAQINKTHNIYICCDFGRNPGNIYLLAQRTENNVYHVVDEIHRPKLTSRDFIPEFAKWYKTHGPFPQIHIFGDWMGQRKSDETGESNYDILMDGLYKAGLTNIRKRLLNKNPYVADRVNCMNLCLRDLKNNTRLLINPKCQGLINDFRIMHYDANGKLIKNIDQSHYTDALGYGIFYLERDPEYKVQKRFGRFNV